MTGTLRLKEVVYAKTTPGNDGSVIVFARDETDHVGVIFHYQTIFRRLVDSPKPTLQLAKEYGWTPIKRCEWLRFLRSRNLAIPQIQVIK